MSKESLNKIWNNNIFNWHGKTYLAPIIPIISDFLISKESNGSLLDFGCGFGEQANVFDELGFQVTGIDSSQKRILKAKHNFPNIFFQQYKFISRLPFKDNSIDIIFSNSVLQYVSHHDFLKECDRILCNGGCVIFIENLRNNPITRLGRIFLKLTKYKYQSYPWNHFTLEELIDLKSNFYYSNLEVFHLISPLAYIKPLKRLYPFFHRVDQVLFKVKMFKRYAWLSVFIGQKN